jgi:predicted DNA-binding protein
MIMTDDIMLRVPKELRNRFDKLAKKGSWKGFPAFVREAIRIYLDHHEEIDRVNGG